MNRERLDVLIAHLEALGTGAIAPKRVDVGLCWELEEAYSCEEAVRLCRARWSAWQKFSGDRLYPVGFGVHQYTGHRVSGDMWADDDYGNARRELCRWLAESLRNHEFN